MNTIIMTWGSKNNEFGPNKFTSASSPFPVSYIQMEFNINSRSAINPIPQTHTHTHFD